MKIKQLEIALKEGQGALPVQYIEQLIEHKFIEHSNQNPGPASLDLKLGEECYEIKEFILPRKKEEVYSMLKEMGAKKNKSNIFMPGNKS